MEDGASDTVVPEMMALCGTVVTITRAAGKYRIAEDSWNWTDEMFEGLAQYDRKIVITTDGKITLARLYDGKNVVKSAEAKCSPEDIFDFMTGAQIALERLNTPEEKEPELKVGMFVKVKGSWKHNIPDGQILRVEYVYSGNRTIEVCGYCKDSKDIRRQLLGPEDYEII
jgi:hypothetical protein